MFPITVGWSDITLLLGFWCRFAALGNMALTHLRWGFVLYIQLLGDSVIFIIFSSTSAKSSFRLAYFMVIIFGVQVLFYESLSVCR